MIARVGRKEKGREKSGGVKFKYKARSAEDVKKRAEQTGGRFDSPVKRGFDMWRPKSGENVIRILPPTWDDFDHYGYDVFMHRYVGSDSSNYVCPNKMKGKPCCICDEAKQLKADGEEEESKKIGFQKRCWVWVIDRDDKSEQPQVWDMSWSQDRDISEQSRYKSGKVLLIDHPDEGFDVIVKKTGSGKTGTKYHFNIERDSSPISEDTEKQEEILKFITENPIPSVIQYFSNEHLEKKMEGTGAEKDEDLDEDDDKPKGKRRSRDEDEDEDDKPRKKRARDVEDEEVDDPPRRSRSKDDDEDEDEEEDEKPKKKRKPADEDEEDEDDEDEKPKKKRKPAEDEDEDEDDRPVKKKRKPADEDDEDEEDEKPRKKKKPAEDEDDEDEDDRPRRRR